MKTQFVHIRGLAALAGILAVLAVAPVPAAAQDGSGLKVGVIDVGRLLEESATGKAAIEDLRTWQETKQAEGKQMSDEAAALRKQITEGQLSLSAERLAELQKDLEERLVAMQRFGDDANREFAAKQNDMLEEIQREVMPIIQAVGSEMGYTMIFNKYESGLVFANEAIDITDLVLARFDSSSASEESQGS